MQAARATAGVTLASALLPVTITVRPVPDAPRAVPVEPIALIEDEADEFAWGALFFDPDGEDLDVVAATLTNGDAVVDDATAVVRLRPFPDVHGPAILTLTVDDGVLPIELKWDVTVASRPDVPRLEAAATTTLEDTDVDIPLTVVSPDGDVPTLALAVPPLHGTVSLARVGGAPVAKYVPAAGFAGADVFTVAATSAGGSSALRVAVDVVAVADPPRVILPGDLVIDEDTALVLPLAAVAVDEDGTTPLLTASTTDGTVTIVDGALRLTPSANFHGTLRLTVQASDAATTTTGIAVVTVNPVEDAPTITTASLTTREDNLLIATIATDSPDGPASLSVEAETFRGGSARILDAAAGVLEFVPARDVAGTDRVTLTVTRGPLSTTRIVPITITAEDDPIELRTAPLLLVQRDDPDAVALELPASALFVDVDDELEVRSVRFARGRAAVIAGTVADETATGALSVGSGGGTPTPEAAEETLIRLFSSTALFAPGTDELEVDVRVNGLTTTTLRFPLFVAGLPAQQATTDEDLPTTVAIAAVVPAGEPVALTLGQEPAHGDATILGTNLRYTPDRNFAGVERLTVQATIAGVVVVGVVEITVVTVNDPPTVLGGTFFVAEDQTLTRTIIAEDPDDADVHFTFTRIGDPAASVGRLDDVLGPNQSEVTFTPTANANGVDVFEIVVTDGEAVDDALLVIVVNPMPDAPTAQAVSAVGDEDGALVVFFAGSDVDGDALTFAPVGTIALGTLTVTQGVGLYTPPPNFFGTVTFAYEVADRPAGDPNRQTARATATLTVRPVNDPPVLLAPTRDLFVGSPAAPTAIAIAVNPDPPVAKADALVVLDVDSTIFSFRPAFGRFGSVNAAGVYRLNGDLVESLRDDVDLVIFDDEDPSAPVSVPIRLADERTCATLLNTAPPNRPLDDGAYRLRSTRNRPPGETTLPGDDVYAPDEVARFETEALCRMKAPFAGFTRLAALDGAFTFEHAGWQALGNQDEPKGIADPTSTDPRGFRRLWGRQRTSELLIEGLEPSTFLPVELTLFPNGTLPEQLLVAMVRPQGEVNLTVGDPVAWAAFVGEAPLDPFCNAVAGLGVGGSVQTRIGTRFTFLEKDTCTGVVTTIGVGRSEGNAHGSNTQNIDRVAIWGRDRDFRLQGVRASCAAHALNGAVLSGTYLVEVAGVPVAATCSFGL